jgi:hypothetical protein
MEAFEYFGGLPKAALTDRMKSVLLEMEGNVPRWNARFADGYQPPSGSRLGFVRPILHKPRAKSSAQWASSSRAFGQEFPLPISTTSTVRPMSGANGSIAAFIAPLMNVPVIAVKESLLLHYLWPLHGNALQLKSVK